MQKHSKKIKRLSAYLPMDRRHALATHRPLPHRAQGAVLMADIAGFTPLAEALTAALGSRRGAEELTRLLNEIYDALIAQVHGYGGSIIGFSGDGFVCWFDGDPGLRAVACGLALQEALAPFAAVQTADNKTVSFSIKAGVATGAVRRFVVGAPRVQCIDVAAGAPLERMAQAELLAKRGEIVVAPETARELGQRLRVVEWREGFGVVERLTVEVTPAPWPALPQALTVEQARAYLLPPVYERLAAGQGEFLSELRPAAMLFLRFGGLDYDDDAAGPRLDAYVRWVQEVLRRYEGYLLQLTIGEKGSYLYAAFGPLAVHEDDTERAVAAALELRQLPPRLDFITEVRIGVSQGRVRAGAYGSRARRTYGALGDEVNVAARLMDVAPLGEIRCSQRVYETAGGRCAFEALSPVQVRGKAEPLPVYRPLSRAQAQGVRVESALVGRQDEIEILARLLAEASSGQRRVLLLEGEAGIGKSRLVGELARLTCERGVAWLMGAGQSIEQHTPYRAWRDLLAAYFDLDEHADRTKQRQWVRERVTKVSPDLIERIPLLNDILRLGLPESDLTRNFDPKLRHESLTVLVIDLLRDITKDEPLVLVLEDSHWLDSLSWELALSVVRALPDQPCLMVLALRPLGEPMRIEYTALTDLEGAETLYLETMPPEETVALAAARLGLAPDALPIEVADLVRERAGDNPFFAEELAYALRDSGAILIKEGVCTLTGEPLASSGLGLASLRDSVPNTVEGMVLSRIDRLPPEQQLTLKVAAVIGRRFLYRTLRDVYPRQVIEDLLQVYLDDLAWRGLTPLEILEPELGYMFKHIITQQVAYDTLLFAQRRDLHRAVAGWYERVYADNLGPYYPLLVHHWNRAENAERERHYAKLAGEQAAAQFANVEAVNYFGRAQNLTPKTEHAARYDLLMAREKVYHLQGERASQAQDLGALQELAETLGDDQKRAQVALRQARYAAATGDYPAATKAAQLAIHLAQTGHAVSTEIDAAGHLVHGRALWHQGDSKTAWSQLEQALTLAQAAGLRRIEADSLLNLGNVCLTQADYTAARKYYEQALTMYREIGDRRRASGPINNMGNIAIGQGNYAEARAYYEQSLNIYREIGDRWGASIALSNLGEVCVGQGDYDKAISYYEQDMRISREIGARQGEGLGFVNRGIVHANQGDYTRAQACFEQAIRICREIGDQRSENWGRVYLGLLFHHLGNDKAARENSQQALQAARELGDRNMEGHALTFMGHALVDQGRLSEAATIYQQALDTRQDLGERNLAMDPLAGLARVSLAQGDLTQAQLQVQGILDHLETRTLDGANEPLRIYLTCYRGLHRVQDPRAQEVLTTAYDLLQERAAKIPDEELRRSYLETVAAHREILAAYRTMQAAGENSQATYPHRPHTRDC